MSFDDRVAVVTGGASGIGRQAAGALARAGADVAVVDIDLDGATRAAKEIESAGGRASAHAADLSDVAQTRELLRGIARDRGRLDVLANIAAIYPRMTVLEVTEEHWDRMLDLNLRGVFFACQEAIRLMLPQGSGAIVNVASGAAFFPIEGLVAYSASKAGLIGATRVLALETARTGIRINTVAPGPTETEGIERQFDPGQREQMADVTAPGRWRTPDEIADAIVYLCSDAARGVHGAVLNVNGGSYMP